MNFDEHNQFTAAVKGDISDDEFNRRVDIAIEESKKTALNAALRLMPSVDCVTSNPIPTVFGVRWEKRLSQIRTNLTNCYGETVTDLIRLAARCFEYSKQDAAGMLSKLSRFITSDGDENKTWTHLLTPDGYADNEGWAYTAYNGVVASIDKPQELLHDTQFHNYPPDSDLLEANGLIWFFEAARLQEIGAHSAMDVLLEASDALDLASGLFMWNEGHKIGKEEQAALEVHDHAIKAAATLAKKRHAENYAMVAQAVKYWRENINPDLSASKAANELVQVVPLSHKKLAEIISAEKRKLQ